MANFRIDLEIVGNYTETVENLETQISAEALETYAAEWISNDSRLAESDRSLIFRLIENSSDAVLAEVRK